MNDDERLGRYVLAIGDITGDNGFIEHDAAQAAMAVADAEYELCREAAEFHHRRFMASEQENARLLRAMRDIEENIQNGGASDAHLILSIRDLVKKGIQG